VKWFAKSPLISFHLQFVSFHCQELCNLAAFTFTGIVLRISQNPKLKMDVKLLILLLAGFSCEALQLKEISASQLEEIAALTFPSLGPGKFKLCFRFFPACKLIVNINGLLFQRCKDKLSNYFPWCW